MGQQQLLLVVLGTIIIGIAVIVGVTMFQANAIETTRNAIINDLGFFAQNARAYYWKPKSMGGGERDFSGVTITTVIKMPETDNAIYYVESATKDELVMVGVGKIVAGDDSVRVRMRINEQTNVVEILN